MNISTVNERQANLVRANQVRAAVSEVRIELAAGVLALAEAIEDPRTGPLDVFRLLTSIRQVGPGRARRAMFHAGVPEHKRVRELTVRQRQALVNALGKETTDASL